MNLPISTLENKLHILISQNFRKGSILNAEYIKQIIDLKTRKQKKTKENKQTMRTADSIYLNQQLIEGTHLFNFQDKGTKTKHIHTHI